MLFFLFVELSAHPLFFFICCLTSCFFSPSLSFHLPSLPSPSHFQPVKVSELLAGACLMTSILDECDTHSRRDALTNPGGRHTLLKEHLINTWLAFLFPLYTENAKQTQTKYTPSVNKYIYTYISNAHPAHRLKPASECCHGYDHPCSTSQGRSDTCGKSVTGSQGGRTSACTCLGVLLWTVRVEGFWAGKPVVFRGWVRRRKKLVKPGHEKCSMILWSAQFCQYFNAPMLFTPAAVLIIIKACKWHSPNETVLHSPHSSFYSFPVTMVTDCLILP